MNMATPRLTTKEAAKYLGVNESRIRQLCLDGTLKATKVPPHEQRGMWYIEKESVVQYSAKRRRRGA